MLSEAIRCTNLNTIGEILIEVDLASGDGSNLTIEVDALGDVNTDANLTGELSGGFAAVLRDERRTGLDVPASVGAPVTLETNVGLVVAPE